MNTMLTKNQEALLAVDILTLVDRDRDLWGKDPARTELVNNLRGTLGRNHISRRWKIGGDIVKLCVDLGFIAYYDGRAIRIGMLEDHVHDRLDLALHPYCETVLSQD